MIPWYTAVAGLVYCAVAFPALLVSSRRKVPTPRAWAFCTVLAVTIVINALGGQDWLYVLLWAASGGMAAYNWRAAVRLAQAKNANEYERI
jgi:hypothetical protein